MVNTLANVEGQERKRAQKVRACVRSIMITLEMVFTFFSNGLMRECVQTARSALATHWWIMTYMWTDLLSVSISNDRDRKTFLKVWSTPKLTRTEMKKKNDDDVNNKRGLTQNCSNFEMYSKGIRNRVKIEEEKDGFRHHSMSHFEESRHCHHHRHHSICLVE